MWTAWTLKNKKTSRLDEDIVVVIAPQFLQYFSRFNTVD